VLPSPTFGMHQYTADLANRFALAGHNVHVVTTASMPKDRYLPIVHIHTPVSTTNTGFSLEAVRTRDLGRAEQAIMDVDPDLVHFTGPHAWNLALLRTLRKQGVPTIHTLHDLDPHRGSGYGALLRIWNRQIMGAADHILVHGETYYERVLEMGVQPDRVTSTPLLHLFVGGDWIRSHPDLALSVEYEPWALFFGRLKQYKGIEYLITATAMMDNDKDSPAQVVIAGRGDLTALWSEPMPERLVVHNRLVSDEEATDLFSRCGLLVLPYVDATQSALIASAYFFRKPVIVTRTGALPEYVEEDRTGRIVEPDHPAGLARCMEDMLSNPDELRRMGTAGRKWYEARRRQEEQALLHAYDRLAGARRRAPARVH
ncbi:MAG: glycosyltransferase family 4 protein, partial [Anaerolineales bacterium]|nr:glycosyltransferase family 4 protein [Anaerolineales bacterium]